MSKRTQRTRTDFLCLTISAGQGVEESSPAGPNYRYTVSVQSDATGATIRFDYHDSIARHGQRVDQLDRENLLYALWSFVRDVEVGSMTFADYCDEYGANVDSISERRTWEACRSSARKFGRLFSSTDVDPEYVLRMLALEGVE